MLRGGIFRPGLLSRWPSGPNDLSARFDLVYPREMTTARKKIIRRTVEQPEEFPKEIGENLRPSADKNPAENYRNGLATVRTVGPFSIKSMIRIATLGSASGTGTRSSTDTRLPLSRTFWISIASSIWVGMDEVF